MANLPTDKTDITGMLGDHAANHNNVNDQVNKGTVSRVVSATVGVALSDYPASSYSDMHAAINAAATAVNAAGGGTVFIRGIYTSAQLQGAVTLLSNLIVEGEGPGSTLQLGNGVGGDTINIHSRSRVRVTKLFIDGSQLPASSGSIDISDADDISIDNLWSLNNVGAAIKLQTFTGSSHGKVRIDSNHLSSGGTEDTIFGGSNNNIPVTEVIVSRNFISQGLLGATNSDAAFNTVAQDKFITADNITEGSIVLGGEQIPHKNVIVHHNIVRPSQAYTHCSIGVLTASNTGQSADSLSITIDTNQIISGHVLVQGQSGTSNRTRKVIIKGNNILGIASDTTENNWGIDLNYLANVEVSSNIIDGSYRGIYINDVQSIDISNNQFINCTTPIVFGATASTNVTGHNNVGINPDVLYAQGNVTGATTFDRANGIHITATQTGNITVTMPSTFFKGELLILEIVTGGFTQTWPSNFKTAGGSLVMTGTSSVTARWDGTNWIEVSRALNVS